MLHVTREMVYARALSREAPLHEGKVGSLSRTTREPLRSQVGPVERPLRTANLPLRIVERHAILMAWGATIAVFALLRPDTFWTIQNFQTIFGSQSALLVVAIGTLFTLAAGEFDLSIGAALSFGAAIFAYLNVTAGLGPYLAVAITLVLGAGVGLVNSLLVVGIGITSLVATLGSGTVLAGVTLGVVGPTIQSGIDVGFTDRINQRFFGLPMTFYIATLLTAATWYVFQHTPFGRYLVFVGRGREIARLSGLRVDLIRTIALTTTAVMATLAGVFVAATAGAVQVGVGNSFLLPAYAAAFLGSTTVRPGNFNAWGAFISVYFLLTGITGLQLVGQAGWPEQVFYGGSLLIAVALARLAISLRKSRAVRQSRAAAAGAPTG